MKDINELFMILYIVNYFTAEDHYRWEKRIINGQKIM